MRCVEKVGQVASFIIVQSGDKFQYFNILKEKNSDIGDKEVKNNISRVLSKEEFQYFLDSLSIKDFKYEK